MSKHEQSIINTSMEEYFIVKDTLLLVILAYDYEQQMCFLKI